MVGRRCAARCVDEAARKLAEAQAAVDAATAAQEAAQEEERALVRSVGGNSPRASVEEAARQAEVTCKSSPTARPRGSPLTPPCIPKPEHPRTIDNPFGENRASRLPCARTQRVARRQARAEAAKRRADLAEAVGQAQAAAVAAESCHAAAQRARVQPVEAAFLNRLRGGAAPYWDAARVGSWLADSAVPPAEGSPVLACDGEPGPGSSGLGPEPELEAEWVPQCEACKASCLRPNVVLFDDDSFDDSVLLQQEASLASGARPFLFPSHKGLRWEIPRGFLGDQLVSSGAPIN